MGKTSRIM